MEYHTKPAPADPNLIAEWESFFSVEMPHDLKALLVNSDGPVLYTEETGKELQILGALEAIEYYESYEFKEYCFNAIPISMDGCGNFVVFKVIDGVIENIYAISASNMGWDDAVYLKSSLTEVIEMEQCIDDILFS